MLRASPSSTWPSRGFEVNLAERDKVRIGHLRHEDWLALVSESDIYFQYDYPDAQTLDETLHVQTELYSEVTSRLPAEPIRRIGIKFVSAHRSKDASKVAAIISRLILLSDEGNRSPFLQRRWQQLFASHIFLWSYRISSDSDRCENGALMLDLDCACRDTFAIPADHLDFYASCKTRFLDIALNIRQSVIPATRNREIED